MHEPLEPQALQDLFDDSVRIPSLYPSRSTSVERSVQVGLERMKVFKTLSHWRNQYSVFYSRDADSSAEAFKGLY